MKFIKYMYHEYKDDHLSYLSAQTSYFLLLSFIPFLIFLLTIIGSLNLPSDELYHYLNSILPAQSYLVISSILSEVLETRSVNITSLLLTLYFATKGVRAIIAALNKAYCEKESRSTPHLFYLSFVFTLIFVFILVLTLFSLVFGKIIGEIVFNYFHLYNQFIILWEYFRYIITMVSMIVVFSFIYRRAPSCKEEMMLKDIIVGSVFTTLCWTLTSSIFAFYVNNYSNSYVSLYGSLSGVFALLVWLYISSTIIILGGEINSYLYKKKKHLID